MELYKVYFDGTEMHGFHRWETLKYTLKRDRDTHGIISEDAATLFFTSDAYAYLKNLYDSGFCNEVKIEIWERCGGKFNLRFQGLIFVVDCRFYLTDCICEVKINDDNFFSRISNNKSIPITLTSTLSKNKVDITPAARLTIDMFDPNGGGHLADCQGITVHEALRFMIDFMSDATLSFESSCFNTGGDYESALIFSGDALYFQDTLDSNYFKPIQFGDFFNWLHTIFNVEWDIYRANGQTIFRVEKSSFYYSNLNFGGLSAVNSLIQSSDLDRLYSKISIGSSETVSAGAFYEEIDFYGFKTEDYIILGKCNIDKTLDLTYDIITSSNAIQEQIEGGLLGTPENNFPDSWFLIDCDINTLTANQSQWISVPSKYFYNELYQNKNVLLRKFGAIPNSIVENLITNDYSFKVGIDNIYTIVGGLPIVIEPLRFTDETTPFSDTHNVWDNTLFEFTAPIGSVYRIITSLNGMHGQSVLPETVDINYRVYDADGLAGGVLFSDSQNPQYDIENAAIGSNPWSITDQKEVFIPQGYKMVVQLTYASASTTISIDVSSYLECIGSYHDDQTLETYNPSDARMIIYEFEAPLTKSQIDTFASTKINRLPIDDGKNNYIGWIEQMDVDRINGKGVFKLIYTKEI
jgi:hypothetical protein